MTPRITPINFTNLEQAIGLNFAGGTIGDVISRALLFIFPIAGLILLLYLIYGGYQFMLSQGDPKALQQAKGIITMALAGFGIIFAAYWIVQLVGTILGINAVQSIF